MDDNEYDDKIRYTVQFVPVSCITFSSSVRKVSGVPAALVPLAAELKGAAACLQS